jgi:hypothetical protein
MAKILGKTMANHDFPNPCGARDDNSPFTDAMHRRAHHPNVRRRAPAVNPGGEHEVGAAPWFVIADASRPPE